jgi:hypothetical protein
MKYEVKYLYDNLGTGYYTEDKDLTKTAKITIQRAEQYISFLKEIGCKCYETSKCYVYEKQTDARHITMYIFYKE